MPCRMFKNKDLWPVQPFLPPLLSVVTDKNVSRHFQMSPVVVGGGGGDKTSL